MLKTSLLTAAAAFVIMAAAPIVTHAQDGGLRQIVVDPAGTGGGGGDGSGGGTGGGGGAGTGGGGGKIKKLIADPPGTASADPAPVVTTPADPAAITKAPDPIATLGDQPAGAGAADPLDKIIGTPATGSAETLDAITGDKPAVAPKIVTEPKIDTAPKIVIKPGEVAPLDAGKAPIEAAKVEAAPIQTVDGLIGKLKTGGFTVDIDHRDSKGDYYIIVTAPKDHAFGYILQVDDKNGHVIEKKKINPAEYGYYAEEPAYGKQKGYDGGYEQGYSEDPGYSEDNYSDGGSGYSSGGGGGSGY